jgi:uncharacterized membrane protein
MFSNPIKRILALLIFVAIFIFSGGTVYAEEEIPKENFSKGRIESVLEDKTIDVGGFTNPYQKLEVTLLDTPYKGKRIQIEHGGSYTISNAQRVKRGDIVMVTIVTQSGQTDSYWITDKYRLDGVALITLLFFGFVIIVARKKGLGAIIGMLLSFLVIIKYIVPQISSGADPIIASIIGGLFIMFTTMYLAHGYSTLTTVSVICTFLSLIVSGVLAHIFVNITHLSGLGSEEAFTLQFGPTAIINLKGLLLGGIIIGVLGVLDDVTTTQTATVFQLRSANKNLTVSKLFQRGMSVGTEHVSSLVNTLIMAYAGVSLPLFILFSLNPNNHPYWVILNNELIVEEVVRSLAGSFGLVIAVPLTTFVAALVAVKIKGHIHTGNHSHHH